MLTLMCALSLAQPDPAPAPDVRRPHLRPDVAGLLARVTPTQLPEVISALLRAVRAGVAQPEGEPIDLDGVSLHPLPDGQTVRVIVRRGPTHLYAEIAAPTALDAARAGLTACVSSLESCSAQSAAHNCLTLMQRVIAGLRALSDAAGAPQLAREFIGELSRSEVDAGWLRPLRAQTPGPCCALTTAVAWNAQGLWLICSDDLVNLNLETGAARAAQGAREVLSAWAAANSWQQDLTALRALQEQHARLEREIQAGRQEAQRRVAQALCTLEFLPSGAGVVPPAGALSHMDVV